MPSDTYGVIVAAVGDGAGQPARGWFSGRTAPPA